MKKSPNEVLRELKLINNTVISNLKSKGVVPATKDKDGNIKIGKFRIVKDPMGFYSILDQNDYVIISPINLSYSAAIIANRLALGYWTDKNVLDLDRKYGHYSFDAQLCKTYFVKNFQSKNYDKAEILNEKYRTAKLRKEYYKNQIMQGFNKLVNIA